MNLRYVFTLCCVVSVSSCSRKSTLPALSPADSLAIVQDNIAHREEMNRFMAGGDGSPFLRDTAIHFTGLHWFPIDVHYRGISRLHRYEQPETVIVLGTKGEERKQLQYGFFEFPVPDENGNPYSLRLNVYKFTPYDTKRYAMYPNVLSVWFTDKTTGKETYHVGRYVEVGEEDPSADHEYTIDLNKSYNPYCAYSDLYSCAVPRKDDRVEIALNAGEKTYRSEGH
jgi:uncharacterized protein (DUF1684 family)